MENKLMFIVGLTIVILYLFGLIWMISKQNYEQQKLNDQDPELDSNKKSDL